jgi:hypothetical protein
VKLDPLRAVVGAEIVRVVTFFIIDSFNLVASVGTFPVAIVPTLLSLALKKLLPSWTALYRQTPLNFSSVAWSYVPSTAVVVAVMGVCEDVDRWILISDPDVTMLLDANALVTVNGCPSSTRELDDLAVRMVGAPDDNNVGNNSGISRLPTRITPMNNALGIR